MSRIRGKRPRYLYESKRRECVYSEMGRLVVTKKRNRIIHADLCCQKLTARFNAFENIRGWRNINRSLSRRLCALLLQLSNLNACFSLFVYLCIQCVRARVFFQVFLLSFYLLPVFFGISRSLLRARTLRRLRRKSIIKVLRCTFLVWANRIVAILPRASYLHV